MFSTTHSLARALGYAACGRSVEAEFVGWKYGDRQRSFRAAEYRAFPVEFSRAEIRSLSPHFRILVGAHVHHVNVGAESYVVGKIPADMVRIVIDHDIIGIP